MRTRYYILITVSLVVLLSIGHVFATDPSDINCSDADTYCAASASLSDVQTAVNNCIAGGGGIVYIPAGTVTWTSTLSVDTGTGKDIRIIGAGQGVTNITDFKLSIPSSGVNLIELAHMTITGSNESSIFTEKFRPAENPCSTSHELYIHDLTTNNYGPIGTIEGWYGVVANCTFNVKSNQYGWYVHGCGDYDSSFTFGTRENIFFEDNIFDSAYHSISGFCNAHIVFRYNTIKNSTHCVDMHGPSYNWCYYSTGNEEHAGRRIEHYHNVYESSCACGAKIRSGHGISTQNAYQMVPDSGMPFFGLKIDGGSGSGGCDDCAHILDYPCSGGVCEGPQKFWIWNETIPDGQDITKDIVTYDACTGCLDENDEYYLRAPTISDDGFTWSAFEYPHPLRGIRRAKYLCSGQANFR